MGLKDYVTKKTIEKITNTVSFIATVKTLEHMEQKNAADSLAGRSKKSQSVNDKTTVSHIGNPHSLKALANKNILNIQISPHTPNLSSSDILLLYLILLIKNRRIHF